MRLRETSLVLSLVLGPALACAATPRLSDILLQVQRLQEEIQQLRGRVEVQEHEIAILKRLQKEQYMDLDARLQGQSGAAPAQLSGQSDRADEPQAPRAAPASPARAEGTPPQRPGVGSGAPSTEKQAYHAAFDLLKQRRYDDAIRAFEDLLVRYPNGEFADNAHYWLGEANYVKRDFSAALTEFQRLLANYPLSPKVPASLLKIGYIHYEKGDWGRARTTLRDVVAKFPNAPESHLAENRLERMSREGH